MSTVRVVALVLVIAGAAYFSRAGETLKPGRLAKEELAALQPGLTLRFYGPDPSDKPLDTRPVRLAALHVPAGDAPSPFLDPGPFVARLNGYLKTSLKGEFTFRLVAKGTAVLRINGKEVLKADNDTTDTPAPILLAKGYNRIELGFTSPAKGDATVRVYWTGEGFATEPLPPDLLFARGDEPDRRTGQARREGRLLFASRSCARCHAMPAGVTEREVVMPEMKQRAPSLEGAGQRLQPAWMARWVLDPRSLRPEARMPHVLHGATAQQDALDLATFLAGQRSGPALAAVASTEELAAQGEKHFEKLGCIACHHLEDPQKDDSLSRLSLFYVKAKFQPGALEAFLGAPHKHYPWIRMPDFHLTAAEGAALAAFLRDRAKGTLEPGALSGDAARGAKQFTQAGCASCHALDAKPPSAAKPRPSPVGDALTQGCLGEKPTTALDFGLSKEQRQALATFLKADGASLRRETSSEFAHRQVKDLQCQACHRRDGQNSRWNQILEDEGLMPEFLPSLTWAGEKLKPAWTRKLLAGEQDHRARPWLKARMPGFPARADVLAVGLSHTHGFALDEDDRPAPDAALAATGAKLIQQQGGFNCVMCHAVGKQPAVAPFEAPGINLLDAAQRLRHNYYPRWMIDPPHIDITTRMPKFSQDGKTTPIRDVLDGDAVRQYEAVWHFIQTLPAKN